MLENPRFPWCFTTPRLFGWLVVALVLLAFLAWLAPQQLPVVAYKLSLVTLAVVLAYWLDRALFPYQRPHGLKGMVAVIASCRRALIVLACVLGLTLGL